MAKKEIAVKKYVVNLSAEERERLEALIHTGKSPAQTLTRARILLKAGVSEAGEGWSDSAISAALDTSVNNVARIRQQLVEEGFEATLKRKYNPNSARPRIFDGAAEAKLIALACSPAPEGFTRWTLRLLEEKVVELNIVEKASDNTIGRTLKKRPQTAPQSAMGDPARSQCRLRRRHGRRAGNLPEAARSRSSSRVFGRDLQAIDRRDARSDPAQARTTRSSRLRIPAQRRRQSLHDLCAAGGLAARGGDRPPHRRRLRESPQRLIRRAVPRRGKKVQDNLSTHTPTSLYAAFPAPEARRLVNRFEWRYTPKHGSWLDMAESELAVLTTQCLSRRIPDKQTLEKEVAAWESHRNKRHAKADWQFTTENARGKLKRLYPQFE